VVVVVVVVLLLLQLVLHRVVAATTHVRCAVIRHLTWLIIGVVLMKKLPLLKCLRSTAI